MSSVLGIDQFSINGIPSDIDLMAKTFSFGWYQMTNGMTANIMARKAWPIYAKYYGPYLFFDPVPDGNWMYQSWDTYADEVAYNFLLTCRGNYGGTAPMIDVEKMIPDSTLNYLFPNDTLATKRTKGNVLHLRMLKRLYDIIELETKKIPIIYTGKSFWEYIGGTAATWASRSPLLMAIYPYDNYTSQTEYLTAVRGVMDGTKKLPDFPVPAPWTHADYIQFTGRAPASLVPGYAKESYWATTVDLNIKLEVPVVIPSTSPAYITMYALNVHETSLPGSKILGIIDQNTTVYVDIPDQGSYAHFLPQGEFTKGGWVFTPYIKKI